MQFVARYLTALHSDLFFADAAIFVEGSAEGMLIPHFIRRRYPKLYQRYLTVLEIGGSHAHRFRELVTQLGLATLVVTDLDAVDAEHNSVQPARGQAKTIKQLVRLLAGLRGAYYGVRQHGGIDLPWSADAPSRGGMSMSGFGRH